MDDLNQMALQQRNIGSVRHMSQRLQSGPSSKRRRISSKQSSSNNDHNHNRKGNQTNLTMKPLPIDPGVDQAPGAIYDLTGIDVSSLPPKLEKKKADDPHTPMRLVLDQLQDKLDIFERDQLEKKKIETAEITATKMKAMAEAMEDQFMSKPHLIGAIPSVINQEEIAFNCWLMNHHEIIFKTESLKADADLFITQLVSLKAADAEWKEFLSRWKLLRIVHQDDFSAVWKAVRTDLNIPGNPVHELAEFSDDEHEKDASAHKSNDKDEM